MSKYSITLIESDEGYAVFCDDLPGCCSQGRTKAEALRNIRLAIREYKAAEEELLGTQGVRIERQLITA
jgi:predicted RNase H-like HicB family nuclease